VCGRCPVDDARSHILYAWWSSPLFGLAACLFLNQTRPAHWIWRCTSCMAYMLPWLKFTGFLLVRTFQISGTFIPNAKVWKVFTNTIWQALRQFTVLQRLLMCIRVNAMTRWSLHSCWQYLFVSDA
jgi:hypothetical protein